MNGKGGHQVLRPGGRGSSSVARRYAQRGGSVPLDDLQNGPEVELEKDLEKAERADLEISPASPGKVFLTMEGGDGFTSGAPDDNLYRVSKAPSGDFEWTRLAPDEFWQVGKKNISAFAVSPQDAGEVVRSQGIRKVLWPQGLNADNCITGCDWNEVFAGNRFHVDVRDIRYSPDGNSLWLATDGGVYKADVSNYPPSNWQTMNNGLGVANVAGIAGSRKDPGAILLGLTHDGTVRTDGNYGFPWNPSWSTILGGDGQKPMVDHKHSSNIYYNFQGTLSNYKFSSEYGDGFPRSTIPRAPRFSYNWGPYASLSPENPDLSFHAGGGPPGIPDADRGPARVMRVERESSGNFNELNICEIYNSDIQEDLNGIRDLFMWKTYPAPEDANVLYSHLIAANTGNGKWENQFLFRTDQTTKGASVVKDSWEKIPYPSEFPDRTSKTTISDVAISHNDPNVIYVVFGGYCLPWECPSKLRKVFKYDHSTGEWTNLSGNLCNVHCSSIALEKGSNGNLYLGTDNGVLFTNKELRDSSGGPVWERYGKNFPHNGVTDLLINYESNTIRAGTAGRGAWENSLLCPEKEDLTLSGQQMEDEFFEVTQIITSEQALGAGSKVTYRAGERIELKPGFRAEATSGGRFHAFIHPCINGRNSFESIREKREVPPQKEYHQEPQDTIDLQTRPNPHTGKFQVSIKEAAEERSSDGTRENTAAEIIVTDMMGRKVFVRERLMSKTVRIDLSEQPDGIYLVKVIKGKKIGIQKVLKE